MRHNQCWEVSSHLESFKSTELFLWILMYQYQSTEGGKTYYNVILFWNVTDMRLGACVGDTIKAIDITARHQLVLGWQVGVVAQFDVTLIGMLQETVTKVQHWRVDCNWRHDASTRRQQYRVPVTQTIMTTYHHHTLHLDGLGSCSKLLCY